MIDANNSLFLFSLNLRLYNSWTVSSIKYFSSFQSVCRLNIAVMNEFEERRKSTSALLLCRNLVEISH